MAEIIRQSKIQPSPKQAGKLLMYLLKDHVEKPACFKVNRARQRLCSRACTMLVRCWCNCERPC